MTWFWVALGSAMGGVSRYYMSSAIGNQGLAFPWGTFCVNASGSLLIGVLAVLIVPRTGSGFPAREFWIIGILGGYTTFSSFSLESFRLIEAGQWPQALAYIVASILVCIAATALGAWLANRFV